MSLYATRDDYDKAQLKFEGVDDTREIMAAKNDIVLTGLMDEVFQAVLLSNEPDEIRAHLVKLAHGSVRITWQRLAAAGK